MLPHPQTHHRAQNTQTQQSQEHRPQSIHVHFHDARLPALRQPLDLVEAVSHPGNNRRCVLAVPEPGPQFGFDDVLEDGRRDGDADGAARAAERVRGRGHDGLVGVVDGGDERDERDGQHAAVADAGAEEGDDGQPGRGVEGEGRDQGHAEEEDGLDARVERVVPAQPTHDDATPDGAEADADGLGDQPCAGLGGGEAAHLEVDGAVEEDAEGGHGEEPVCQARGEDGAVEEEAHGDDGLVGVVALDVDEDEEGDDREGEGGQDQGVRPWDDVASGVQAEEQQDQGGNQCEGAEPVDPSPSGPAGFSDRNLDGQEN